MWSVLLDKTVLLPMNIPEWVNIYVKSRKIYDDSQ